MCVCVRVCMCACTCHVKVCMRGQARVHMPSTRTQVHTRARVLSLRSNARVAHLGPRTRLAQGSDLLSLRGCGRAALECEGLERLVLRLRAHLDT